MWNPGCDRRDGKGLSGVWVWRTTKPVCGWDQSQTLSDSAARLVELLNPTTLHVGVTWTARTAVEGGLHGQGGRIREGRTDPALDPHVLLVGADVTPPRRDGLGNLGMKHSAGLKGRDNTTHLPGGAP